MQLPPTEKLPVALLGATGSVGQVFLRLLTDHPWFQVESLMASSRSAGQPYAEAARWVQATPLAKHLASKVVEECRPEALEGRGVRVVFSALDADVAGPVEEAFARAGYLVVSNAKNHRMDADVPLLVPEVNADHVELARTQDRPGAILTNPNCSTIGLVLALKPIADAFGLEKVNVVTMQALSGAGVPGVPSLEILDNLIPYIGGEEDKLERETHKILGKLVDGHIESAHVEVSAQCNRVPVFDGHTLCVSVGLEREAPREALVEAWNSFRAAPQELSLPSAPQQPTRYLEGEAHPQPRLHRDLEGGMAVSVGGLRPCPLLDYKFVTLSHNTVRGAAGGSLLVAELALARGLLD